MSISAPDQQHAGGDRDADALEQRERPVARSAPTVRRTCASGRRPDATVAAGRVPRGRSTWRVGCDAPATVSGWNANGCSVRIARGTSTAEAPSPPTISSMHSRLSGPISYVHVGLEDGGERERRDAERQHGEHVSGRERRACGLAGRARARASRRRARPGRAAAPRAPSACRRPRSSRRSRPGSPRRRLQAAPRRAAAASCARALVPRRPRFQYADWAISSSPQTAASARRLWLKMIAAVLGRAGIPAKGNASHRRAAAANHRCTASAITPQATVRATATRPARLTVSAIDAAATAERSSSRSR